MTTMTIAMAMRIVVPGPSLDAMLEDGDVGSAVMEVGSVVTETGVAVDSLLGVLVEDRVAESVGVGTLEVMSTTQVVSGKRANIIHISIVYTT